MNSKQRRKSTRARYMAIISLKNQARKHLTKDQIEEIESDPKTRISKYIKVIGCVAFGRKIKY